MSTRIFFINEDPAQVQTLLRAIHPYRIQEACAQKGLPPATNLNNFSVVITKGRMDLCYRYIKGRTRIMELSTQELPHIGWRLYISH